MIAAAGVAQLLEQLTDQSCPFWMDGDTIDYVPPVPALVQLNIMTMTGCVKPLQSKKSGSKSNLDMLPLDR